MTFLTILGVVLIAVWGLLNAIAAIGQMRAREIPLWSAIGLLLGALGLFVAAWLLATGNPSTMLNLIGSLLLIHVVTIYNGYHLFGRFKASHHLGRLAVSLALIAIAYFAL
jgi:hypothetical protein